MKRGKIKFYNDQKGFGFIIDSATNQDVFFHASALDGLHVNNGDNVAFDTEKGKKGINAINIRKA